MEHEKDGAAAMLPVAPGSAEMRRLVDGPLCLLLLLRDIDCTARRDRSTRCILLFLWLPLIQ